MEISGVVWRCVRAGEHWKNVGLQVAPLTMGGRTDVVRTQSLDLLAHNRYRTAGAATRTEWVSIAVSSPTDLRETGGSHRKVPASVPLPLDRT
jgi:hypothetical protein